MTQFPRPARALLALTLAAFFARGAHAATPDLVLISIDTLRSDRLPAYGYAKGATPAIDALAADSILFEHAYSHVPLTLPSHATIFTGLLPGETGVHDNTGYHLDASRHPTIALLLGRRGYATAGAISSFVLRPETGIAAGFDSYEARLDPGTESNLGLVQRSGAETLARAKEWLETSRKKDAPFFLFVHFYEPHTPYTPPEPFASRFPDPYDGEIATADALVGELVAELRRLGLYDGAAIVLLSDHGEGLGDHQELDHGVLLYREALQVPLLLKLPAGARKGTRVSAPAQLLDVAPTLLRLAGAEVPEAMKGTALVDLDAGTPARPIVAETYYPRLHMGWSDLHSLVEFPLHLISGPDPELYDLAKDPKESRNVRDDRRREFHRLTEALAPFRTELAEPSPEDAEATAKLAALGYLGAGSARSGEKDLPDPKSQFGVVRSLGEARALFAAKRYAEAATHFEAITKESPGMIEAWAELARSYEKMQEDERAIDAYEHAMRLSSGSPSVALALANLLRRQGDLERARRHAELALSYSPTSAHLMLASIALEANDDATAEREARAALEAGGGQVAPLLALARIQWKRKDAAGALGTLDQAEKALATLTSNAKTYPGIHLLRGDVLAATDRRREATESFKREIEAYPDDPWAYAHLARTYAGLGRRSQGIEVVRQLIATNPDDPATYRTAVQVLRSMRDFGTAEQVVRTAVAKFPADPSIQALADRSRPIREEDPRP